MPTLSDPAAVQKLVRHFSQNTGVVVRLDYSNNVMPYTARQADGSVKVVIPAWLKADDLGRMLAACLHESGHVEYDVEGIRQLEDALKKAALPGWAQYLHNVVADARIDARRIDAFAGARALYGETWAYSDDMNKEEAGKRSMADDEKARLHVTCLGALAAALGFEADAPWIAAGPFANHPKRREIIDLLQGVKGEVGTLLPEALRLLALLALDPTLKPPPPPQPGRGGGGAGGQGDPSDAGGSSQGDPQDAAGGASAGASGGASSSGGGTSPTGGADAPDAATLDAFDKDTARLQKGRGLKSALRDPQFRDRMRTAANRVFRGQTIRDKEEGSQSGPLFHTSPATFGNAVTPFSKAELVAARTHFVGDAIRAFVESTRDAPGDDDYRDRIDRDRLPGIVSDPLSILIGETTTPRPNCAVDVLLDVSGSMQSPVGSGGKLTRMAALLFALRTWIDGAEALGASGVRMGIRLFATDTARHLDFTELSGVDRKVATGQAIENGSAAEQCGGGTNCRIGLEASIRDLAQESARRKAIVLITDGAIMDDDYQWIAKEWPDGVSLAVLAVSDDATGMFGTDNDVFKFRALQEEEVGPMLASALREAVDRQAARG